MAEEFKNQFTAEDYRSHKNYKKFLKQVAKELAKFNADAIRATLSENDYPNEIVKDILDVCIKLQKRKLRVSKFKRRIDKWASLAIIIWWIITIIGLLVSFVYSVNKVATTDNFMDLFRSGFIGLFSILVMICISQNITREGESK